MNTLLNLGQKQLQDQFQLFAWQYLAPLAKPLAEHKASILEFLQKLGEAGYFGITVPGEYGGQGAPFINSVLLVEALAAYEPGVALSIANQVAACEILKQFGTQKQRTRYLPLLARAESIAAIAFTEEDAGTDFAAVQSKIIAADGGLMLVGKKIWVVNAQFSNVAVVLAACDSAITGGAEIGLVLVDLNLDKSEIIKISANREKLGLRSAFTNDLEFIEYPLTIEAVLPAASESAVHEQVLYTFDIIKVLLAAACIGLTAGAFGQAVEHACDRKQFNEAIGNFQGLQWKLADASCDLDAARLLTYRAACAKDENVYDFRRDAAMCKLLSAKIARLHSGEVLQILATRGIGPESSIARFYCDAKMMEIFGTTAEFQKILLTKELDIA